MKSTKITMKEKVLQYVESRGSATFTQIQRFIIDTKFGESTYDQGYQIEDTYIYDKSKQFKSRVKQFVQPKFFRPAPTPTDYEVGFIQRYIVSHNLDTTRFPIEIGVSQANTYGGRLGIDSGIWTLHRIKWVIVGSFETTNTINPATGQPGPPILSVEDQNRATLEPIIRRYPMMEFAFRNYTEFAQSSLF